MNNPMPLNVNNDINSDIDDEEDSEDSFKLRVLTPPKKPLVLKEGALYQLRFDSVELNPSVKSGFSIKKITEFPSNYSFTAWYAPDLTLPLLFDGRGKVINSVHPELAPYNGAYLDAVEDSVKATVTLTFSVNVSSSKTSLNKVLTTIKSEADKMTENISNLHSEAITDATYLAVKR